jgi:hypothetical protein
VSDQPTTSRHTSLAWLVDELKQQLGSPGYLVTGANPDVAWYMRYGFSIGLNRDDLEASLGAMPELQAIAANLSDEDISQGKPTPTFIEGQVVEVIVNARNTTYRKGRIRSLSWYHKEGQWIFLLEEDGKKVSKRYETKDLRAADA